MAYVKIGNVYRTVKKGKNDKYYYIKDGNRVYTRATVKHGSKPKTIRKSRKSTRKSTRKTRKSTRKSRKSTRKTRKSTRKSRKSTRKSRKSTRKSRKSTRKTRKSTLNRIGYVTVTGKSRVVYSDTKTGKPFYRKDGRKVFTRAQITPTGQKCVSKRNTKGDKPLGYTQLGNENFIVYQRENGTKYVLVNGIRQDFSGTNYTECIQKKHTLNITTINDLNVLKNNIKNIATDTTLSSQEKKYEKDIELENFKNTLIQNHIELTNEIIKMNKQLKNEKIRKRNKMIFKTFSFVYYGLRINYIVNLVLLYVVLPTILYKRGFNNLMNDLETVSKTAESFATNTLQARDNVIDAINDANTYYTNTMNKMDSMYDTTTQNLGSMYDTTTQNLASMYNTTTQNLGGAYNKIVDAEDRKQLVNDIQNSLPKLTNWIFKDGVFPTDFLNSQENNTLWLSYLSNNSSILKSMADMFKNSVNTTLQYSKNIVD